MTRRELDAAFTAVELAFKHAVIQAEMPDRLQQIADIYGRDITTPANIRAVLDCIDVSRLLALIDAPPTQGATPCHNAPSATAP